MSLIHWGFVRKLVPLAVLLSLVLAPVTVGQGEDGWTIEEEEPVPQFRLGPTHQGFFTGEVPLNNTTLWTTEFDAAVLSSPVVTDGRVYVGTMDGDIVCMSAYTGNVIWNYSTGGPVESSPAVHDGYVYVGSDDGRLYKLTADTGELRWRFPTGGPIKSSPTVADGKVIVGSNDFNVYCYDIESGDELWNFSTGGYVFSSATVSDGNAYFGSCDGRVYCVNITNGSEVWRFQAEYIPASPVVVGQQVIIGTYDQRVYWLNKVNGMEYMNVSGMVSGAYSSAAVMNGPPVKAPGIGVLYQMTFVADNNGTMYGIGMNGDIFWEQSHPYGISSSPLLVEQERLSDDAFLIYGVLDGTLHMRDIRNPYIFRDAEYAPPVEWSIKLGTSIQSSPFIYHGKVYVGVETANGGKMVCIGDLWPQYEVVITIDTPTVHGDFMEGVVLIEGTFEGLEPDRIAVQFDVPGGPGSSIQEFPEPGRWSTSYLVPAVEGPKTLRIQAWKDGRFVADEVLEVMILVEGWSSINITIDSPVPREKVEGVLLSSGTASSNYTLQGVLVRIGKEGPWVQADGLSNWTAALDTFDLPDGEHKLWVRVTDEHRTEETSVRFRIGDEKKTGGSDIVILEVVALLVLIVVLVVLFRTKPPRVSEKAPAP